MPDIYLCGHGAWSKSGFTSLPKNTTLRVYTPVGRYLGLDQARAIMQNSPGALTSDQYFKPFESVTDMTLQPCPEYASDFAAAAAGAPGTLHMVTVNTQLSELLKVFAGNDLYWLACRVRFGALDTTQGGLNEDYRPQTGMGVSRVVGNVDAIRSNKVGGSPAAVSGPSGLDSNPAFNRAKHRAGL